MPISLVTGVAGFIGSHVAQDLLRQGHVVVGLDDLSGGYRDNVPEGVIFYQGSVTDTACVQDVFKRHVIDYVFHLAAYAAVGLSHYIKHFNYMNNVIGSVNVINAAVNAKTVKCFIFTSSISVYGEGPVPMTEAMVPVPIDPYGVSKYTIELELECTRRIFGLPYVIFRPYNVYGERQNIADKSRNVVGIFINQALRQEPFTIYGDGQQRRAFSYIDDVAPLIAQAYKRPDAYNQVFNVGASVPFTINHLAQTVALAMQVPLVVKSLPARDEAKEAFCSSDKVTAYFGDMIKQVPLEEGVRRMVAWAKTRPIKAPKILQSLEINNHEREVI